MNKLRYLFLLLLVAVTSIVHAQVNFSVEKKRVSPTEIDVIFKANIASGWHVYGTNIPEGGPTPATFNIDKADGVVLKGTLKGGKGLITEHDKVFGMDVSFYKGSAVFTQRLQITKKDYNFKGYLEWGACNDQSCLPPSTVDVSINGSDGPAEAAKPEKKDATTPAESATTTATAATTEAGMTVQQMADTAMTTAVDSAAVAPIAAAQATDSAIINKWYNPVIEQLKAMGEGVSTHNRTLWYVFIMGALGGFLALLTPCVWPIIPMTVSFFLHRSDNRRKAIKDAIIYGVSIVIIYVLLGIIITALFGPNALNALSTNIFFNILFFLMLLVFAASFLGGFEITLPSSWTNKVDSKASEASGLLSIFLMAFTLTLVSFSCTGPIIGFLLVEVSTNGGSILAPTIGMLGFAIALALPFTLFALFPSWLKKAPKSGGWMNTIKVVLGFVELAFSLKFLSVVDLSYGWHLLDREVFLALWIGLFFMLAAYLFGWIRFPHDDERTHTSIPSFFVGIISLAFSIYMLPGLWGAPVKAVSAFAPPLSTQDFNLDPVKIEPAFKDYEAGMAYAKQVGKPVLLDFTGHGCVNCRKMELAVWHDPQVRNLLTKDYVLISLYVDEKQRLPEPIEVVENGKTRTLRTVGDKWSYLQSRKFGTNSQPFYVPIDNEGNVLNHSFAYKEDIPGYIKFLKDGLENYKNNSKKD